MQFSELARAAPKNNEKRSTVQESQSRIAGLGGRQPACVLRPALASFFLMISGNRSGKSVPWPLCGLRGGQDRRNPIYGQIGFSALVLARESRSFPWNIFLSGTFLSKVLQLSPDIV
jgi:hypothetical protein